MGSTLLRTHYVNNVRVPDNEHHDNGQRARTYHKPPTFCVPLIALNGGKNEQNGANTKLRHDVVQVAYTLHNI